MFGVNICKPKKRISGDERFVNRDDVSRKKVVSHGEVSMDISVNSIQPFKIHDLEVGQYSLDACRRVAADCRYRSRNQTENCLVEPTVLTAGHLISVRSMMK